MMVLHDIQVMRQRYGRAKPANSTYTNQVVARETPTSPEVPVPHARVILLRASDGAKAWAGRSNAQGYYTATGLEDGESYVAVALDPTKTHQATAAGPVTSVLLV